MNPIPKSLAGWITSVIAGAPHNVSLVYLEWNDARRGSRKVISFHAFGYSLPDFHPEDPSSLGVLSEWQWEAPTSGEISSTRQWDDLALRSALLDSFSQDESLGSPLTSRGGQIAFGAHEGAVTVFPEQSTRPSSSVYNELHVTHASNSVDVHDDLLDNDPEMLQRVISNQKLDYPLTENATFHLQARGKELDLLYAVRWFICSDRMRDLIQTATPHCQVFPIRLYRSKKVAPDKLIGGYSVLQLYEQLECLDPADVLPPPYDGFLPEFDPVRGYRIVRSLVGDREIFRIAYEHRRLVVSQSFRDKCDSLGITGVEWLRRESVE